MLVLLALEVGCATNRPTVRLAAPQVKCDGIATENKNARVHSPHRARGSRRGSTSSSQEKGPDTDTGAPRTIARLRVGARRGKGLLFILVHYFRSALGPERLWNQLQESTCIHYLHPNCAPPPHLLLHARGPGRGPGRGRAHGQAAGVLRPQTSDLSCPFCHLPRRG